jgi:hypothetical protein
MFVLGEIKQRLPCLSCKSENQYKNVLLICVEINPGLVVVVLVYLALFVFRAVAGALAVELAEVKLLFDAVLWFTFPAEIPPPCLILFAMARERFVCLPAFRLVIASGEEKTNQNKFFFINSEQN